jgi:hypothetical protein
MRILHIRSLIHKVGMTIFHHIGFVKCTADIIRECVTGVDTCCQLLTCHNLKVHCIKKNGSIPKPDIPHVIHNKAYDIIHTCTFAKPLRTRTLEAFSSYPWIDTVYCYWYNVYTCLYIRNCSFFQQTMWAPYSETNPPPKKMRRRPETGCCSICASNSYRNIATQKVNE